MYNPDPKLSPLRLKGKAYTDFRKEVYTEHGPNCNYCGGYAPHMVEDYAGEMKYIEGRCGEVCHIKSAGSGGADVIENTRWGCWYCHRIVEHGPRFGEAHKGA